MRSSGRRAGVPYPRPAPARSNKHQPTQFCIAIAFAQSALSRVKPLLSRSRRHRCVQVHSGTIFLFRKFPGRGIVARRQWNRRCSCSSRAARLSSVWFQGPRNNLKLPSRKVARLFAKLVTPPSLCKVRCRSLRACAKRQVVLLVCTTSTCPCSERTGSLMCFEEPVPLLCHVAE